VLRRGEGHRSAEQREQQHIFQRSLTGVTDASQCTICANAKSKFTSWATCPCPQGLTATGGDAACAKPRTTAPGVALKWSYVACKPVVCGTARTVANSKQLASLTTFGSVRAYICETGFEVKAQPAGQRFGKTVRCLKTAAWEAAPVCSPVKCGTFPTVANAHVTSAATSFGSTAAVTRKSGFAGGGSIECTASGRWSSPARCFSSSKLQSTSCGTNKLPVKTGCGQNITTECKAALPCVLKPQFAKPFGEEISYFTWELSCDTYGTTECIGGEDEAKKLDVNG